MHSVKSRVRELAADCGAGPANGRLAMMSLAGGGLRISACPSQTMQNPAPSSMDSGYSLQHLLLASLNEIVYRIPVRLSAEASLLCSALDPRGHHANINLATLSCFHQHYAGCSHFDLAYNSVMSLSGNKVVGIRREDKNKWERRVPLTPDQVKSLVRTQSPVSNGRLVHAIVYFTGG